MLTLVIQAHPLTESYSAALLEQVLEGLSSAGVAPSVARIGQGDPIGHAKLAGVEHLIVVAPTWWAGPPAVLLDWVQTHLSPWIDDRVVEPSPLHKVRRLSIVTSHGSSKLINRLQGEPGRQLWKRSVLPQCANGAVFDWIALYKIDQINQAARAAFLQRVAHEIAAAAR